MNGQTEDAPAPCRLELLHDASGTSTVEYGLLVGLLSIGVMAMYTLVGSELSALFLFIAQVFAAT